MGAHKRCHFHWVFQPHRETLFYERDELPVKGESEWYTRVSLHRPLVPCMPTITFEDLDLLEQNEIIFRRILDRAAPGLPLKETRGFLAEKVKEEVKQRK